MFVFFFVQKTDRLINNIIYRSTSKQTKITEKYNARYSSCLNMTMLNVTPFMYVKWTPYTHTITNSNRDNKDYLIELISLSTFFSLFERFPFEMIGWSGLGRIVALVYERSDCLPKNMQINCVDTEFNQEKYVQVTPYSCYYPSSRSPLLCVYEKQKKRNQMIR